VKKDLDKMVAAVVSNSPSYFGSSSSVSVMRGILVMSTANHQILTKIGIKTNTEYTDLAANAMALIDDDS